jgi:hypothetical protein
VEFGAPVAVLVCGEEVRAGGEGARVPGGVVDEFLSAGRGDGTCGRGGTVWWA